MELKRFFVEPTAKASNNIIIDNQEYYHIVKVMRYKVGYKLIICMGDNKDYYCTIESIDNNSVVASIDKVDDNNCAPSIKVILYPAIIKEDNFELVVQKAVEIGAYSITPVITQYVSERNLRIDRLNKIALEACKQCGRSSLIQVNEPIELNEAIIKSKGSDLSVVAYEKEKQVFLKDIIYRNRELNSISLFIGSEGGFNDDEKKLFETNDISCFSLGRRILRAETASIVALGNIMYELDR